MKRLILLSTIFILCFASCKKDDVIDPSTIQPGVWYCPDPVLQLPIKNVTGEGDNITFLDYTEGGLRYLKVTSGIGNFLYIVKIVEGNSMTLIDTADPKKIEIKLKRQV